MIWLRNLSAEYLIHIVEWVTLSIALQDEQILAPPPPLFPLSSHNGYTNEAFAKGGLNNVC